MAYNCEFQLSSPNGVYYSGQFVSGEITLITSSDLFIHGNYVCLFLCDPKHCDSIPKTFLKVSVRLVGESKVSWTEAERDRKANGKYETRTFHFRTRKVYIDNSHVLLRGMKLTTAGTHKLNFRMRLPRSCPTSCEGKYGQTRYELWLIVDAGNKNEIVEYNKPLTVLRTVDLNLRPAFRVPLQAEEISNLGCWHCNSGKIAYSLRVPFGAYAPGQTIRYSLLIQNQTMTDIRGYTVKFNEHMTFTAHFPHYKRRETDSTLAAQKHAADTCVRLSNRKFYGEFVLPALPPDTEGNRIVSVRHTLNIELEMGRCHTNKCISVPIFIGTVPFREIPEEANGITPIMSSAPIMPSASIMPSVQIMPSAPLTPSAPLITDRADEDGDLPPSYVDFKPPTFEEAIRSYSPFRDPDANENTNVIGFRPLYPVYPSSNRK